MSNCCGGSGCKSKSVEDALDEIPVFNIEIKTLERKDWTTFDIATWRLRVGGIFGGDSCQDLTYLGSAYAAIKSSVVGDLKPLEIVGKEQVEFDDDPTDYSLAVKHAGKLIEALIKVHDKNGNILKHPELQYAGGENKISYIDVHEDTKA